MTIARSAEAIERLAYRVERLSISRHDPERFFEDRSEIVFALRDESGGCAITLYARSLRDIDVAVFDRELEGLRQSLDWEFPSAGRLIVLVEPSELDRLRSAGAIIPAGDPEA